MNLILPKVFTFSINYIFSILLKLQKISTQFSLLVVLFLSCAFYASGMGPDRYYFKQISLKDGLSQSNVRSLQLDHKGYLWIGTVKGLNRYDGNDIVKYLYSPNNQESLPSNGIHFVYEDKNNDLWVGTDSAIVIYNRAYNNFKRLPDAYDRLSYRQVIERGNELLFIRQDRILHYNTNTQTFSVTMLSFSPRQNISATLNAVLLPNNQLLIGFRWQGLFLCDLKSGKISRCLFYPYDNILNLYVDDNQNIWCSALNNGVMCFSPQGKLLAHYTQSNSGLNNPAVYSISSFSPHEIWMCTDGGGINILDTRNKKIRHIKNNPEDNYSLPVNSINFLYQDPKGNRWIGTTRGGVVGMKANYMRTYINCYPTLTYGLSQTIVNHIDEDDEGHIWIATDGEGVNRFTPKTGLFRHYPHTFGKKITSIQNYNNSNLLISSYREGIFLMNKASGDLRPIKFDMSVCDGFGKWNMSINILRTSPSHILMYTDSILKYDMITQQIEPLRLSMSTKGQGALFFIKRINDHVYLHHRRGIFVYSTTQNDIVKSLSSVMPNGMEINTATISYPMAWIGNEQGLYKFHLEQHTLEKISSFPNFSVETLEIDNNNNLWIGALGRLYRYSLDKRCYYNYNETDGVIPNEFISKSKFLASDGSFYMGGIAGLLRVDSSIPSASGNAFEPTICDVFVNGKSIDESQYIETKSIEISPNHTTFGVHITSKNGDILSLTSYQYKLDGYNDNFITSTQPIITFNDLPPGNYRLLINTLQESDYTTPLTLLSLHVLPFWWQSWWFVSILLAVFIVGLLLIYRNIHLRQKQALERHIIDIERENYEKKVRFLININHEIRTPLTLITLPLNRLLKNKKDNLDSETQEILTRIYRQAKQIKSVIDIILDIRKSEVTQENVHPQTILMNEWAAEHISDFISEYEAADIQLNFEPSSSEIIAYFDPHKCDKVISNLLINALKFSPPHTTVTAMLSENGENVRFTLSDMGCGISDDDAKNLFQRFYQGAHSKGGSGIGLSYSKMLIEMHGGSMGAYNNDGSSGASFYFELPIASGSSLCEAEQPQPNVEPIITQLEVATTDFLKLNRYSLLIVEDQDELRTGLQAIADEYFDSVYTANDGIDALKMVEEHDISIVVSDIMMPNMDGYELCQRLKENSNTSHIPIILLTARSNYESTFTGYQSGADGYVTKPFDMDILLLQIQNILHSRLQLSQRILNRGILSITENESTLSDINKLFIQKLDSYIVQEINSPELSVDDIAKHMAISRTILYAKTKSLFNVGLKEYINIQRINTAKTLLCETSLSVSEVCDRVGYSQQRYFSVAFKQFTGVSPLQFRAANKKVDK